MALHRTLRWSVLLAPLALLACQGTGPILEVPTPSADEYVSLHATAIHAVSDAEVFVVGSLQRLNGTPEGLILSTETRGREWRRLATEVNDLARTAFQTVFFIDRLRGCVGGVRITEDGWTRAVMFRTGDGGNHWQVSVLPMEPDFVVVDVHGLHFADDFEGICRVRFFDPKAEAEFETTFSTTDAGRTWQVAEYRVPPATVFSDALTSFLDDQRAFRVRPDVPRHGLATIEVTASGGRDWMPLSELDVAGSSRWY